MIEIKNKAGCCGCTACAAICPKYCIEMREDLEGFRYPNINNEACIQCGACERICPILNPVVEEKKEQRAYLVQHKDEVVRKDSSAGGAFTAIAAYTLKKGGVVFGASYDENFKVIHRYVDNQEELWRFRNSKYVQSNLGDCFRKAKAFFFFFLWVCCSGIPCYIEVLNKYL